MVGKYVNRYDVTLLVNGLPLIQIELKRRGVDIREAVNQVMRYKKHSYNGLYHFIQLFVVSNGVDTKYFATLTEICFTALLSSGPISIISALRILKNFQYHSLPVIML